MERLLDLFLLLWRATGVNGQGTMDIFINDLVATFQLTSPTILYDEEVPETCYTSQWVLCLSTNQPIEGMPPHSMLENKLGRNQAKKSSI